MEIKNGAAVVTHKGDKVGTVNRVVVDPRTERLTHVIVARGFLFTTDKVIPIEDIQSEQDDQLILTPNAPDFSEYIDFEETTYVPVYREDFEPNGPATYSPPPVFWYPPYGSGAAYPSANVHQPFTTETERNVPEGNVSLAEGSDVYDSDDNKAGEVGRLFTYGHSSMLTHFVLVRGGIFDKQRVVIPVEWVAAIREDAVYLAVPAHIIDDLPEYKDNE